jgi:iron(III) transport system permease protein
MTIITGQRQKGGAAFSLLPRMTAWDGTAAAVAVLVLLPILVIAAIGLGGGFDASGHATRYILPTALTETGLLVAGIVCLSALIGVGAGWLIAIYRFPGRNVFGWALILPFAIPTYISAYAYVEALDYFGPVQGLLRSAFGFTSRRDYWFPEVRSLPGAIIVNALVLYPYIYIASRAAFSLQGAQLIDAARSLGCSRITALRRVVLPAVIPMIAAGATLVVLESLNDIGASQYLGINTLTVAIYSTWLSKSDLAGAAQIAMVMLCVIFVLLWTERYALRNRQSRIASRGYRPVSAPRLRGWQGIAAMLAVSLPVLLGFVLPFGVLVQHAVRQLVVEGLPQELLGALGNSLVVASFATVVVLLLALLLAFAARFTRLPGIVVANRLAGLGYALPGTVLVIGLMPALGFVDRLANDLIIGFGMPRVGLILSGSVVAVVLAYTIRFLAIGLEQVETGLATISRNTDFAAYSLGCAERPLAWRILAPALRPVLAGAAILIFVDCLKELPATLLLRPLNFETLATQLYGHASRGSFEDGSVAALLIVLAGLAPLVILNRMMHR